MLRSDATGTVFLQYEVAGRIRRIPMPRAGVNKRNVHWKLGGCLLEVAEEGVDGSAQLYLATFDEYLIERLETIGVGKDVKASFHIDTRERYENYSITCILDSIELADEGSRFLMGDGKKEGGKA